MPSCSSPTCACSPNSTPAPIITSAGETVRLPPRATTSSSSKSNNQPLWKIDNAPPPPPSSPLSSNNNTITATSSQDNDRDNENKEQHAGIAMSPLTGCELLKATEDLEHKCDKTPGSVCCKDQVEVERNLISKEVVRDIIIGLSDGLMVPFALTAGLSSLGSSKLVYQGGFGELISGAISMGIGGYLAAKAEQDSFRHKYVETVHRLSIACSPEIDRAVHEVLGPLGIQENVSRVVAKNLGLATEADDGSIMTSEGFEKPSQQRSAKELEKAKDEEEKRKVMEAGGINAFLRRFGVKRTKKVPTTGTTAFLMKFGEGMEEVPQRRLMISAFTIGISYFLGGLIPIIPYLCVGDVLHGLYYSILATGIVLLIFGWLKAWFTGAATGKGGLVWGAISTLAVGAAAAAASYGVVYGLSRGEKV